MLFEDVSFVMLPLPSTAEDVYSGFEAIFYWLNLSTVRGMLRTFSILMSHNIQYASGALKINYVFPVERLTHTPISVHTNICTRYSAENLPVEMRILKLCFLIYKTRRGYKYFKFKLNLMFWSRNWKIIFYFIIFEDDHFIEVTFLIVLRHINILFS